MNTDAKQPRAIHSAHPVTLNTQLCACPVQYNSTLEQYKTLPHKTQTARAAFNVQVSFFLFFFPNPQTEQESKVAMVQNVQLRQKAK
jgi:hypothetical protein